MKKIIACITFCLIITGCSFRKQPVENMPDQTKQRKKIAMVVSPINFRDQEYFDPRGIFDEAGYMTAVVSIQSGRAKGADGGEIGIDKTVGEIDPADYDAVVFIGGPGMAEITGDDSLQALAQKFYNAGKITSAICVAPAILAKAGILKEKHATSWDGVKKDLEDGGADFTGDLVTTDGIVITANSPAAAKGFGEAIVKGLAD
jgi:protease I